MAAYLAKLREHGGLKHFQAAGDRPPRHLRGPDAG